MSVCEWKRCPRASSSRHELAGSCRARRCRRAGREPSSFAIGWWPAGERSMIASRRLASPTPCSTYSPPSSGPRWRIASFIARISEAATGRPARVEDAGDPAHQAGDLPARPDGSRCPRRAARGPPGTRARGSSVVSPTRSPGPSPRLPRRPARVPSACPASLGEVADADRDLVAADVHGHVAVALERGKDAPRRASST